jgi:hypothetical protein
VITQEQSANKCARLDCSMHSAQRSWDVISLQTDVKRRLVADMCRDMPILTCPKAAFVAIMGSADTPSLAAALGDHFGLPGSDLEHVRPPDWSEWTDESVELSNIGDQATRRLAARVHGLWPLLFIQVWRDLFEVLPLML